MNKDIFLSNSLGGKKEKFVPIDSKKIGMYVCGPTVYDDPHIGNARPLIVFDILFKIFKNKYSKVTYVRNITDMWIIINSWATNVHFDIILNQRYKLFFLISKIVG